MQITPGYYKHYKGKYYKVHFIALHSETLEPMVCYEALYENDKSKFWVRPAIAFIEKVAGIPRFKKIKNNPLTKNKFSAKYPT